MTGSECERFLKDIAKGNSNGLKRVYLEYSHAVFLLVFSIVKDRQAAEDVTQDVFLKIWTKIDTYKFGRNPRAWIMTIAKNTALNELRKMHLASCSDIDSDSDSFLFSVAGADTGGTVTDRIFIEQCLDILPDTEREIFVMHYAGDLTYIAISKIMNMPLPTVARYCSKGAKRIKEYYKKTMEGGAAYGAEKTVQ